jgi:hypothetical protein
MKNLLPIILLSVFFFGCAKQYPVVPIAWKTLPEFNVPYDKAWSTVLDVITEKNINLDVVQKDAGYIKSTKMFWNGQSFILSVKFYSKSPVIIKLEKMGTLYNNWTGAPIDTSVPSLEKILLDEIEGRLRKISTLSDGVPIKSANKSEQSENKTTEACKDKLIKLQKLYKDGLITKKEYESERLKVLDAL